jgi:hypothetical protein
LSPVSIGEKSKEEFAKSFRNAEAAAIAAVNKKTSQNQISKILSGDLNC